MKFLSFSVFILLFLLVHDSSENELSKKSIEKDLIQLLRNRYEHYGTNGRPVNNSFQAVKVQFGLALIQILGLDENTQILRTNCWGRYRWHDELMTWDPAKYNGIETLRVFRDQIWVPDIQLYNFADERLKVYRDARIVVSYDGSIMWIPQALFKSSCSVEISYFPFDVQICRLDFGSYTYDRSQLELFWWVPDGSNISMPYVDFRDYIHSNEWFADGEFDKTVNFWERKKQIKSQRFLRSYNVTDGERKVTKYFTLLRYRIRIRRNASFYIFILIIPCVLLSTLVLTVFWLPPESPAKPLLGMNIFVAFFVLLLLLKSSIPTAVRTFPLIGSFFCLNMIMITLSTFLVTIVINFYVRGDRKGPIPNYIRRIMIDGIGRLVFVSQFIPLPKPQTPEKQSLFITQSSIDALRNKLRIPKLKRNKFVVNEHVQSVYGDSNNNNNNNNNNNRVESRRGTFVQELYRSESVSSIKNEERRFSSHNHRRSLSQGNNVPNTSNVPVTPMIVDPQDSPIISGNGNSSIEKDVKVIRNYVRNYIDKQKVTQRRNQMTMEWRALASVLDRLFSIFYLATILIAVIIGIPTQKDLLKMEEEDIDQNLLRYD